MGSAPAEKAGSAAAMSEMVQELGVALGVAVLGSLASAVYRGLVRDRIPADLPEDVSLAVGESLWAAVSVVDRLPGGVLEEAREAFTRGFNVTAGIGALGIAVLAILSATALRHVGAVGAVGRRESADSDRPGTGE